MAAADPVRHSQTYSTYSTSAGSAAETKMGVDIRDIPADAAEALPERFREAGFSIELIIAPDPEDGAVIVTEAICRRGGDEQRLSWGWKADKVGECRVAIANARGWRRSVRERRYLLQMEVTAIIERAGGYWPFSTLMRKDPST